MNEFRQEHLKELTTLFQCSPESLEVVNKAIVLANISSKVQSLHYSFEEIELLHDVIYGAYTASNFSFESILAECTNLLEHRMEPYLTLQEMKEVPSRQLAKICKANYEQTLSAHDKGRLRPY